MAEEIGPCNHCGCPYTYIHAQARGPVQIRYDKIGRECEVYYEELLFVRSRTVRCRNCGKIRRDLEVDPVEGVRPKQ